MRDSAKLAFRLRGQIRDFAKKASFGLGIGRSRAVWDVLWGLCKGGDVKLTSIGRALIERTKLENVVERLSRNLASKDFSRRVNRRLVGGWANQVDTDTLLVIDETDVQKRCASSM